MVELGMTFSMEQLVIDNEIIRMFKKTMEGVRIDDQTLDVENIKEGGVGCDFIGNETTLMNIDIQSKPTIFDRDMLGQWMASGSKNIVEVAHAVVEDVMANYKVLPIPEDRLKAMDAVMDRVAGESGKKEA